MLVDTSVWVDHFRNGNRELAAALERGHVWCHPFIQGELACGNLMNRAEILALLGALPRVPLATHDEALAILERRQLWGTGLGWVDVHLIASALLGGIPLWTLDQRLSAAADHLGL